MENSRRSVVLAWPRASVRPCESLWSLVHRFLWLNTPKWEDMKLAFGCPSFLPFSLLYGQQIQSDTYPGQAPFNRAKLARIFGLTSRQWTSAALAWIRGTPVDDVITDLRFCPECLRAAFHSVVFQLPCMTTCPIHGSELLRGCPVCGQSISTDLDRTTLCHSYACPSCGYVLAPDTCLVNPPPIDGRIFSRILNWYRFVGQVAFIAPQPTGAGANLPVFASCWRQTCLEDLAKHRAPAEIALSRDEFRVGRSVRARCGMRLTRKERWYSVADDELRRHTLIYKSYRRHTEKMLSRESRRLLLAFVDGQSALWKPAASPGERDTRAAAYGLLLFRSRMEDWPDLFHYGNPVLCQRMAKDRSTSVPPLLCGAISRAEFPFFLT